MINLYCFGAIGWIRQNSSIHISVQLCGRTMGWCLFVVEQGNHLLRNVNINSGYVGIYMNNSDRSQLPELRVENCRIHNFVLWFGGAECQCAGNEHEISNTGSYSVYLSGGKHVFLQSTIANYYNSSPGRPSSRDKNPAVIIIGLQNGAHADRISELYCCRRGSKPSLVSSVVSLPSTKLSFPIR